MEQTVRKGIPSQRGVIEGRYEDLDECVGYEWDHNAKELKQVKVKTGEVKW